MKFMTEREKMAYTFLKWPVSVYLKKIGIWKSSCHFKWKKTWTKWQSERTFPVSQQNLSGGGSRNTRAVFTEAGKAAGGVSDPHV